jgi:hypothetical protein
MWGNQEQTEINSSGMSALAEKLRHMCCSQITKKFFVRGV